MPEADRHRAGSLSRDLDFRQPKKEGAVVLLDP